jgi:hypothetical protein
MYAEFSYEPHGQHSQEAPEKDNGDDQEAGEKIAKAAENQ